MKWKSRKLIFTAASVAAFSFGFKIASTDVLAESETAAQPTAISESGDSTVTSTDPAAEESAKEDNSVDRASEAESTKTESTKTESTEKSKTTSEKFSRVQKNQDLYQEIESSSETSTGSTTKSGWSEDYQKYYVDGIAVIGFKTINGKDYYFNEIGIKTIGQKNIGDFWYCFLKNQTNPLNNGIMVKKQFFNLIGTYHASWDNDKTVYYDENGHMLYNQKFLDGYWYCFDKYSGAMKTGFVFLGTDYHASWDHDKTVYYDENGHMVYDFQYIDGNWYYFNDNSGAMATGFIEIPKSYSNALSSSSYTVYFMPDGKMVFGQKKIGKYWYCFQINSGAMITGFMNLNELYRSKNEDDKVAYYDKYGHMLYKQQKIDGYWYCFDKYSGAMKTGFVTLKGDYHSAKERDKTVYYDENGHMLYTQQHIGDYWYCFDKYSGAMKTGFVTLAGDYHSAKESDKTVYYDSNGHMLYKQKRIGNFWYCFDKYSGAMKTGFVNLTGDYHSAIEGDKTVYYDQNGHMQYKQKYIDGYWYCFDKYSGAMKTGFVFLDSDYHSRSEKDKTVYYDSKGHMLYGQQYINGNWYCFRLGSGAMVTGDFTLTKDYLTDKDSEVKTVYYDRNGHLITDQNSIKQIKKYYKFRDEVLGKEFDLDKAYGAQCWDGYAYYAKWLGYNIAHCTTSGYVKDIWEYRKTNGILKHFMEVSINDLQPGDVCVFRACTQTPLSHIAIYDGDIQDNQGNVNKTKGKFLGQNQYQSAFNVIELEKISKYMYVTAFRPNL